MTTGLVADFARTEVCLCIIQLTPSPITVTSGHIVDECMRIVTNKRIRHLPVVDEGGLKGVVSIGDLVKAIISSKAYTIDQLHAYSV